MRLGRPSPATKRSDRPSWPCRPPSVRWRSPPRRAPLRALSGQCARPQASCLASRLSPLKPLFPGETPGFLLPSLVHLQRLRIPPFRDLIVRRHLPVRSRRDARHSGICATPGSSRCGRAGSILKSKLGIVYKISLRYVFQVRRTPKAEGRNMIRLVTGLALAALIAGCSQNTAAPRMQTSRYRSGSHRGQDALQDRFRDQGHHGQRGRFCRRQSLGKAGLGHRRKRRTSAFPDHRGRMGKLQPRRPPRSPKPPTC